MRLFTQVKGYATEANAVKKLQKELGDKLPESNGITATIIGNADDVAPNSEPTSGRYARFNGGPHICVELPDGHSCISVRLQDGRRVTFAFVPYEKDGAPQCVDIDTPDAPKQRHSDGRMLPVHKSLSFMNGRRQELEGALTCVLLPEKE